MSTLIEDDKTEAEALFDRLLQNNILELDATRSKTAFSGAFMAHFVDYATMHTGITEDTIEVWRDLLKRYNAGFAGSLTDEEVDAVKSLFEYVQAA